MAAEKDRFYSGYHVPIALFEQLLLPRNLYIEGLVYYVDRELGRDENGWFKTTSYSAETFTDPVLLGDQEYISREGRYITFVGIDTFGFEQEELHEISHDIYYGGGLPKVARDNFTALIISLMDTYKKRTYPYPQPDPFEYMHMPINGSRPKLIDGKFTDPRWPSEFFAISLEFVLGRSFGNFVMPEKLKVFYQQLGISCRC